MKIKPLINRIFIALLAVVVATIFVNASYAYFDTLQESANENVTIGDWPFSVCTEISTAQEFYDFATSSTSLSTDDYCLVNDIDFSGFTWTYISTFNNNQFIGQFDGRGYTLSNITMVSTDTNAKYFSIFSRMNGATIKNVVIDNFNMGFTTAFFNTAAIQSSIFASQVTGTNNTIENITINNSQVIANTLNGAGGLVTQVEANADITIKNIKARNLTVLNESRRAGGLISRVIKGTGTVTIEDIDLEGYIATGNATSNTGGLVGTIQNATLNISRVIVEYTASGTVNLADGNISYTSSKHVGGLIGNTQTGSIMNIDDTFFTGELQTVYNNLGSIIGRRKVDPTMTDSYFSNALFGTSNTPTTSTGVYNATMVNATSMPSQAWWDTFKVDFDAVNSLWTQDGTGRLELIRP